MEISFLNVDLEIESNQDLQTIVDEFGINEICVLYHGQRATKFNFASFMISDGSKSGADEIISSFCNLIENLSDESRLIWNNCHSRKFDAGFQGGDFPRNYQTEIRAGTIERVAQLGASIAITIYPKSK